MNNLKNFRKQHSLTQSEAAALLGYKLRTWQEYEQGRSKVPEYLITHINHYEALQTAKTACSAVYTLLPKGE